VRDFVNRRPPFREEHLCLTRKSYDPDEIQLAGARLIRQMVAY